jgi:hypothetical protein
VNLISFLRVRSTPDGQGHLQLVNMHEKDPDNSVA